MYDFRNESWDEIHVFGLSPWRWLILRTCIARLLLKSSNEVESYLKCGWISPDSGFPRPTLDLSFPVRKTGAIPERWSRSRSSSMQKNSYTARYMTTLHVGLRRKPSCVCWHRTHIAPSVNNYFFSCISKVYDACIELSSWRDFFSCTCLHVKACRCLSENMVCNIHVVR